MNSDDFADPVWIDDDEVVAINEQSIAIFGGMSHGVRDENLLKAAVGRPLNKWVYEEPKPDLFELAAAYCFGLSKGHAFYDGNKRVAYIVAVVFLELNGVICSPEQSDIITAMLKVADGSLSEGELAVWFRRNSKFE